ncbi:MAG: hypothetical protein KDA77_15545, partial [Planctomycetaceae bacterium]|nr:hypothetical protein [Planctomycetaceae bacterium]
MDEPLFEEDDFLLGEMVTCPVCGQLMDSYLGSCQACENQEAIREFENDSSDEMQNLVRKSGKVRVTAVLS